MTIGQSTQYFERLPDGDFRLREVAAGSAESAHCDVVFSARAADGAGESLIVTCRPEIATVRDRQAIPGVNLEVGKPVLASFSDEFKFTATRGEWSCLYSRAAGGGDYGLLILVKASPKTLPAAPAPVVRTVPAYLVVDVTDRGKKVPLPGPDHPAYYFPAVIGYHALGELKPGESTPPVEAIDHLFAEALFARGYRVMSKKSGPSLVLTFAWGYLAPGDGAAAVSPLEKSRFEHDVMLAMINGDEGTWANPKAKGYKAAINSDRYYVFVSAFDAADALKHRATLLWHARISTAARDITLREALPSLIAAAGPAFGRATPPVAFDIPLVNGDKLGSSVVAISQIKAPASVPELVPYNSALNQAFGMYEDAMRNNSIDGASPVVTILQGQNNTLAPNQR